jgi:hypothetical protein
MVTTLAAGEAAGGKIISKGVNTALVSSGILPMEGTEAGELRRPMGTEAGGMTILEGLAQC